MAMDVPLHAKLREDIDALEVDQIAQKVNVSIKAGYNLICNVSITLGETLEASLFMYRLGYLIFKNPI
jgi:hypothetical protein